jgi:hypothetical protein
MTRLDVITDIFGVISFSDLRALLKIYKAWEPLLLDLEKTLAPPAEVYKSGSGVPAQEVPGEDDMRLVELEDSEDVEQQGKDKEKRGKRREKEGKGKEKEGEGEGEGEDGGYGLVAALEEGQSEKDLVALDEEGFQIVGKEDKEAFILLGNKNKVCLNSTSLSFSDSFLPISSFRFVPSDSFSPICSNFPRPLPASTYFQ